MKKQKNANYIFWIFIYFIVFLQLSTSKDLPILVSVIFSLFIVFTLKIYLGLVLKRLIDRYLKNSNAKIFILITLMAGIVTSLVLTAFGHFLFLCFLPEQVFINVTADMTSMFFGIYSFTILFSGAIFGLELLKHRTETEKQEQILRNTVLEMEIDHLRTQLSPHFTFNILNNLQFLIRKDTEAALEMLSRYSSILRYYVYESNNKWIRLNDEISFIKHYIHLEKDRSGPDLQMDIHWNVPENRLLIIPFVLSTFVENAFKHVSTTAGSDNFIKINIALEQQNLLILDIRNTFTASEQTLKKEGIGLINVKKRLELAYPDNYVLDIDQKDTWFQVQLQIKLAST